MKTKLLLSIIGLALTRSVIQAVDWQPQPMEFPGELRGTIVQISGDGMLVDGAFKRDVQGDTIFPGPFFLKGFTRGADGDAIDVKALPAGMYTYVTVLGATRTVKALSYSNE